MGGTYLTGGIEQNVTVYDPGTPLPALNSSGFGLIPVAPLINPLVPRSRNELALNIPPGFFGVSPGPYNPGIREPQQTPLKSPQQLQFEQNQVTNPPALRTKKALNWLLLAVGAVVVYHFAKKGGN